MDKELLDFILKDDEAISKEKELELKKQEIEKLGNIEEYLRPNDFHIVFNVDLNKMLTRFELFDGPGTVDYYDTMTIGAQLIDYAYEIEKGKAIMVYAGDSIQMENVEIRSLWITTTTTNNSMMQVFLAGKRIIGRS